MQQSQEKRSQFRKQIRRRHINQQLQQIRNLHRQREKNSLQVQQSSPQKKQETQKKVQSFLYKSIINYQSRNYEAMMKEIESMGQLVGLMPQIVTQCLNEELAQHGAIVIDGVKKDVSKGVLDRVSGQLGVMIEINKIEEEMPLEMNLILVNRLLEISRLIQYQRFSQSSAILIIKALQNVIDSRYHLSELEDQQKGHKFVNNYHEQILSNLCISLSNILDGAHHNLIKKHLQKLGLSQKLNQIIDVSVNYETKTHKNLLRLLYLYNSHQLDEKAEDHMINGISIVSSDCTYKEKYAVYCIYFLKKNWHELYEPALLTLNQILEENPYFIDSIKTNYYDRVLELMLDADRKINVAALSLLATLAFYSPSASDQMVQQNNVLDFIYGRLRMEAEMIITDPQTKKSIAKCTNILCDLLLTRNQKIKKIMFKHQIWQLLYQSIDESNRLFSTVVTFKYFFSSISRKERNQILPSFLEAVSHLSLSNQMIPEIKEIKETLYHIFYHSMEHNNEENHEEIVRLFQINNLIKYIEEYDQKMATEERENEG